MSVALEPGRHKQRVRKHRVLLESASDIRSAHMPPRQHPNILVTGTPGTGKTTHCELIASEASLRHINVGDIVKEHDLHDGYSNEFDAYYVDDDKVCLFVPTSFQMCNCRQRTVDAVASACGCRCGAMQHRIHGKESFAVRKRF